jgi:hypothetical protein
MRDQGRHSSTKPQNAYQGKTSIESSMNCFLLLYLVTLVILVILTLVFWPKMSLLDATGDIDDTLIFAEPVEWAVDLLNLTTNECLLRLVHVQIKHSANVPIDPGFKALL